jgi:hypothetical protein
LERYDPGASPARTRAAAAEVRVYGVHSAAKKLIHIDFDPGSIEFFCYKKSPASLAIELYVTHTAKVGGHLDLWLVQCAYAIPSKAPKKVAQFKDNILPCSWPKCAWVRSFDATGIITDDENDRESNVAVVEKLLNNRSAAIRFLIENHGLKVQFVQKSGDRGPCSMLMTVDEENLPIE